MGNGLILVYERLLIQTPCRRQRDGSHLRRADGLTRVGVRGGVRGGTVACIEAFGVRTVLVVAGRGGLLVWALSSIALRRAWDDAPG